jgi:integrase
VASLYYRGKAIWVSYKDASGRWRNKNTGYRKDNLGELRQAGRLRDALTLRERTRRTVSRADWSFVAPWIEVTYGHLQTATPVIYRRSWRWLSRWLAEINVPGPINLRREECLGYPAWRAKHGGCRNTAVQEMTLLGQIVDEAIRRGLCENNPARKLRIRREVTANKRAWTEEELAQVDSELASREPYGWMRCSFLLGRYQAARLHQCSVPLDGIDFERRTIFYPKPKGGSERAFNQTISKQLLPTLREIADHRKSAGKSTLCDVPDFGASIEWRRFLDSLGISGVSHHDLRRTWITKAALAGIPESVAQAFSNHSSTTVHRIYMRFTTADMAAQLDRLK